ncbi:MAG: glucose-6-phosphate dehydrogenase assembly protein OpcA, partial [Actinomycetales bacterium]|nr:glucose-6-phosphate dehydrogenase assembly protein OpcA [Actinomycetales bacterium]
PAHDISMPLRNLRDCLSEELRRLDPDTVYGRVIQEGIPLVNA